jgi:type II secretory pathway pseudopilin PulG
MRSRRHRRSQGAVLLAVLVFILIGTLAAGSMVVSYQQALKRDKEEQLLFAGDQIRRAILAYYNVIPPGGARSLPSSLDALVEDRRFATPLHHLRRIYPDPMTGTADWDVVKSGDGIIGVRSASNAEPLKKKGFAGVYSKFEDTRAYSDWTFAITP